MKISLLVILICWLCIVSLCFSQIGSKAQAKIYGIWHNNDFGYQMTLRLNTDGTGEFDGESVQFKTQGNSLIITAAGASTSYTYNLTGNSLSLSGGDLDQAITFTRQGAQTESASEKTTAKTPASQKSNSAATSLPKNLIGVWSGYNEIMEFKTDGQCLYRGQPFPYSVSGNYITLQTAQGNVMMAYSVSGNQLQLTINNQNLTYTKGTTGSAISSDSKSAGGKKIDQTLVGKWCYVNVYSSNSGGSSSTECITLKEDGTYEYYSESSRSVNTSTISGGTASQGSDQGTWWVQGSKLFYNSQTQGQGSYELVKKNHPKNTNDPMIVLDGRTYVTFFNKPAW